MFWTSVALWLVIEHGWVRWCFEWQLGVFWGITMVEDYLDWLECTLLCFEVSLSLILVFLHPSLGTYDLGIGTYKLWT